VETVKIRVEAGAHNRLLTPVEAFIAGVKAEKPVLIDLASGREIPVQVEQVEGGVKASWLVDWIQAGGAREYELRLNEESSRQGFTLKDEKGRLGIAYRGYEVAGYVYSEEWSKPYMFPVRGPGGIPVTENGPADHVHHRSLWVAHGEVNGQDLWSEHPGRHGKIRHISFKELSAGPVYAKLVEENVWTGVNGEKLLDETRFFKIWGHPLEEWIIDAEVTFKASYGDVLFADTKEAGILSIRVAESMKVKNGGLIVNSAGGINEPETWGRRAHWCDYSGPVSGVWLGIAVFDHPANPGHPTYWHVRNYGLMTANIFGITYFEKWRGVRGDLRVRSGSSVTFRYRVILHRGTAFDANLSQRYMDYVNPPRVTVLA